MRENHSVIQKKMRLHDNSHANSARSRTQRNTPKCLLFIYKIYIEILKISHPVQAKRVAVMHVFAQFLFAQCARLSRRCWNLVGLADRKKNFFFAQLF